MSKARAKAFFEALDGNEKDMGEGAALAVTLEQFGYEASDVDVLADMAEALDGGARVKTEAQRERNRRKRRRQRARRRLAERARTSR